MNPLIQSKNRTILAVFIALTLGCFALPPQARAVCQQGCSGSNTFLGEDALSSNIGIDNTAIGLLALVFNGTGNFNTATGAAALVSNTAGNNNTASGHDALEFNGTGNYNTATGSDALEFNSTGNNNTATGAFALFSKTTGSNNIALGFGAGQNLNTGSNNIYIGSEGVVSESRTIRIGTTPGHGRTFIAGISGVTVAGGVGVIVDTQGQLGTVVSSARFKDEVKPMDKASEAILALKPVTFRYKHEVDAKGIPQFGLVAEDVEKVNPDLVARDSDGKAFTVRYEAVNAMLLNEFLKEHRKGEQQDRKIGELEAIVAKLQSVLKEQASQIQKANARLEANKPAPQVVLNNH